jgi:hypothetical protein
MNEVDMLSFQSEKEWLAIPRIARTVPFGYKVDPDDPDLLQPIILELEALEQAKVHLRQFGYRAVAQWLHDITGRRISAMGLQKRIKNEKLRRRRATALENLARRAEEAHAKAQSLLEARRGGYTRAAENSGDDPAKLDNGPGSGDTAGSDLCSESGASDRVSGGE